MPFIQPLCVSKKSLPTVYLPILENDYVSHEPSILQNKQTQFSQHLCPVLHCPGPLIGLC